MKIIGKHKDYFDHLVYQYGVDEKLILDRRGIGEFKEDYINKVVGYYTGTTIKRDNAHEFPRSGLYTEGITSREVTEYLVVNGRGYPLISKYFGLNAFGGYLLATEFNCVVHKKYVYRTIYQHGTLLEEFINISKQLNRHAFIIGYRHGDYWAVVGDYKNLAEIGLSSIISPQEMYLQTVDFVSEHLTKKVEVEVIQDNKQKIVSHGFDLKTSFRGSK
jgi:hypothetical protein